MARLPTYQPRGSVTRGPQSSLSASEIANPYQQIANAFGNFAEIADRKETDDARIEGQNAVYTDEAGNLKVDLHSNWTEKGRVYNAAAAQTFGVRSQSAIRTELARLQMEAKGNIDTFRAGAKSFRDTFLTNTPQNMRGAVMTMMDTEIQQGETGVISQKFDSDMVSMKSAIAGERDYLMAQAKSLAFQGGTNTDAYKSTIAQIQSHNSTLTGNPFFRYSQQESDFDMKRLEQATLGQSFAGQADRLLRSGDIAGARALSERVRADSTTGLNPVEQRQFSALIDESISGYKANIAAERKPYQEKAKELTERLKVGDGIDNPDVDATIKQLASLGDVSGAIELTNQRALAMERKTSNALPLNQRVDRANTALTGISSQDIGTAKTFLQSRTDKDPSHIQGMQDGFAVKLSRLIQSAPPEMRDKLGVYSGARSVERQAELWQEALKKYGSPEAARKWVAPPGNSQHNHGNAADLSFGGASLANAPDDVVKWLHDNAGQYGLKFPLGNENWHIEDDSTRGGAGTSVAALSADQIKFHQEVVTDGIRDLVPQLESGMKQGFMPDEQTMSLLGRSVSQINDPGLRDKIVNMFDASAGYQEALRTDPVQAEASLSAFKAAAMQDGVSVAEQNIIAGMEAGAKARSEGFKKDPLATGAAIYPDFPSAPPLDLSQPDTWGATFQAAQRGVSYLQARGDVGNVSVLRPAEEAAVAQIFQTGQPQQLAALGNALSSLRPETLKATLSSDGYKAALTGAILSSDPIRHGEAMKQLDLYSEVASWPELEGKFGPDAANRLQDWQARVRYMTPDESTEWLRQRNAPDWQERVKPLVKAGETEARKVEFNDAMEAVAGGWFIDPNEPIDPLIRDEFLRDYVSVTGIRNGSLGDVDAAKKDAATRLRGKWGSTEVLGGTGGRLMLYPPEKYYPDVNGSKTWIREEMNAVAEGFGVSVDNMSLISDAKTEAAVQRGETPGYLISVIDPETGARDLLTDDDGKVIRHEFNPKAAQQWAMYRARDDRANFNPSQSGRHTPPSPRSPITITHDRSAIGRQFGIQDRQDGPTIEGIRQGIGDVLDTMMLKNTPKPARKRGE